MTPFLLGICLHYYYSPEQHPSARQDGQMVVEAFQQLKVRGLLREIDCGYAGTEALKVYVDALCSVPLPVTRWVIPWEHMDGQ